MLPLCSVLSTLHVVVMVLVSLTKCVCVCVCVCPTAAQGRVTSPWWEGVTRRGGGGGAGLTCKLGGGVTPRSHACCELHAPCHQKERKVTRGKTVLGRTRQQKPSKPLANRHLLVEPFLPHHGSPTVAGTVATILDYPWGSLRGSACMKTMGRTYMMGSGLH